MTTLLERLSAGLGERYQIDWEVSSAPNSVLYSATDTLLRRRVGIRVNTRDSDEGRQWFRREAEALAQLDHPAIRHIYDVGTAGSLIWRIGNWMEGEGLDEAVNRRPRPIPHVHILARALLGALEHSHNRGIIFRRLLPSSIIVGPSGRGVVTDIRHSSFVLPFIPEDDRALGLPFTSPEVRRGETGDPASDVYSAAAVLYFALTGKEPALEHADLIPPTTIRHTIPQVFDRLLLRALDPDPMARYITAWEMFEDFASEAGDTASQATFIAPLRLLGDEDLEAWEKLLRRALGDDYELLGEVGRGGYGRVYKVRDLHLERIVALKVLAPTLTQHPEAVERFRREAQLAARLRHPHVIDIYDIGGRYGMLWYTMELVEGPNLAQLVEAEGPLPVDRVLRILREGLSALAEAHRLGMVHRDIKPENVLIDPTGAIQITDFGLALALRRAGAWGGATSRSGTPQFASPEQLLGEHVDQRTDLYSLSALAYFSLLGRPPFMGRSVREILARQALDDKPDLRKERPDISEKLSAVLGKAIRSDPDMRYRSAAEFQEALTAVTQPISPVEESSWTDLASRFLRRRGPPN